MTSEHPLPHFAVDDHPRAYHLTVHLSSTRRGARLARRLAAQQLASWGWSYDSRASRDVSVLVAELATNAVSHGRLSGRDFRLRLTLEGAARLRVEVTDSQPDLRLPAAADLAPPPPGAEWGRGLLLVDALADRWGVRCGLVTKTVWCELTLTPSPG